MKPNNEFTSPEQRFFYPDNHGVEHHESLDTTGLPGTENIPGEDHYVVIRDSEGKIYAADLGWNKHNIPVNTVVLGVKGQKDEPGFVRSSRHLLAPEEFEQFDPDCEYIPRNEDNTQMIVQVDMSRFWTHITDPRFDDKGIAILPHGTPIPSFSESGIDDEQLKYRLLGFINSEDKLVTWHGETGRNTLAVDWCVANQLKQNSMEEALLIDALHGIRLVGLLRTTEAAKAYLEDFDAKHGTSFTPKKDPRSSRLERKFKPLTRASFPVFEYLTQLAHDLITSPR